MLPLVRGQLPSRTEPCPAFRLRGDIRVIRLRRSLFPKTLQFIQGAEQTLVGRDGVAEIAVRRGPVKDEVLPEFFGLEVQTAPLLPPPRA